MRALIASALIIVCSCEGVADQAPPEDVDARPPAVERGLVAMAVARLVSRHSAALLAAIDADATCGFQSPAAKASLSVSGQPGDDGSATWTVSDCAIELTPEQKLDTNCDGAELWIGGRAIVSATRIVHGVVTTDPDQPLAPDSADAAQVTLNVAFDRLTVRESSSDTGLTVFSGALSFTAAPRLAVSQSVGLCTVPTPQLKLDDVQLRDVELELQRGGRALRVTVPSAKFSAQVGQGTEHENWLSGEVTVWETAVQVPTPDDLGGLVPGYDRDAFIRSFQCRDDLQQPVSHVCPPPREKPAQAAAALSVKLLGVVAKQLEKDTACGFASPMVKNAPSFNGATGSKGTATYTLAAPCTLQFGLGTVVDTDCMGAQTVLSGEVSVTGTKSVRGWLTGDPAEPVVPASSSPATLALVLKPSALKMTDNRTPHLLSLNGGTLTGSVEPKTALDKASRACAIATPAAKVTVAHDGVQVEVQSGGIGVPLTITRSTLDANSGPTNHLAGTVTAAGQVLSVPSANAAPVLDPKFDLAHFEESYRCAPNLEVPADEVACSFTRPLGEGAARLLVRNAAALAKLVNDHGGCGFTNEDILTDPYLVIGRPGQLGRMGWQAYCGVGPGGRSTFSKDCNQVTTYVEGSAAVPTTREVDGVRDEICGGFLDLFCADTIIPIKPDAVVFQIGGARLNNFGVGTDEAKLVVKTGTLKSTVRPMQGRRRSNGHYDVGTPVASVTNLILQNAVVTLVSGKKTFTFPIAETNLNAFSGAFAGKKNSLSGTLTVDSVPIVLGNLELQPGYSQAAFDQAYACTNDLTAPLVP